MQPAKKPMPPDPDMTPISLHGQIPPRFREPGRQSPTDLSWQSHEYRPLLISKPWVLWSILWISLDLAALIYTLYRLLVGHVFALHPHDQTPRPMKPDSGMGYAYLARIEAHLDHWEETLQGKEPFEEWIHPEDVRALIQEIKRLRAEGGLPYPGEGHRGSK